MKKIFEKIFNISTAINLNAFIILMLMIISLFEIFPAVEQARKTLPTDFYNYTCFEALENRPWYGQMNTWFWFWLISTPIIILSFKSKISVWQKSCYIISAIILSYVTAILVMHMMVELRNAPFNHEEVISSKVDKLNEFKYNCFDTSSGGLSEVYAILFGWIYTSLYVGFWLFARWISRILYNKLRNLDYTE